jgi:hypothetical protein
MNESNESAQLPIDQVEAVRKPIVPIASPIKSPEGKRSPTKTERDLPPEVLAAVATPVEGEVVRKLVVPGESSEQDAGDRSPTKTERDVPLENEADEVSPAQTERPVDIEATVRKLVIPEA